MAGPLFISAMQGLGDAVYQRPFVRAQGEVRPTFVDSCWPEMYEDLPGVHLVKPRTRYRTQAKNLARLKGYPWAQLPAPRRTVRASYTLISPGSICDELERRIGLAGRPFVFDLPTFGSSPARSAKPIAVLRPVTHRAEWRNTARSPRPEYIEAAAIELRRAGYHVVLVADVAPPAEVLEGDLPEADETFIRGELSLPWLLALIENAAVVVGGSGFIVPVSIAFGTPLVVIGGGQGGHNAPDRVTDPRMDCSRARWVLPDRFCLCTNPRHACDKEISDFSGRFRETLLDVTAVRREVAA